MTLSPFSKFYKKEFLKRIETLTDANVLSVSDAEKLKNNSLNLPQELAEHMIENQFSLYTLPVGAAFHFLVDDKKYTVPMATEEPSVVAAANYAAKVISKSGGFHTTIKKRHMIGQVVLKDVADVKQAKKDVESNKGKLLEKANSSHPSIVKRGGGAIGLEIRVLEENPLEKTPSFFVVHFFIDTLEAMGANIVNTMMEAVSPLLEKITDGSVLMGILTNLASECLATTRCAIPSNLLRSTHFSGDEVRDRIVEASQFAQVDPYRATTNNKGIFNGIDAVVLATGNDWRAIEAGGHAYAAREGRYRSLSKWTVGENGELVGNLTMPLPIGTVGGSISLHPHALLSKRIMKFESARELEAVIVSVGLAQNFAALKALVTEGIQKGHMNLHAKSLALSIGATGDEIEWVASQLADSPHMNQETALAFLKTFKNRTNKKREE